MRVMIVLGGLMALCACGKSPEAAAIEHNATLIQDSLEREADNLEAMANNAADADAARAMANAAAMLDDASDNVADAADAARGNLR